MFEKINAQLCSSLKWEPRVEKGDLLDLTKSLGAVIRNNVKPAAFYGRKLTGTHKSYTATEKEPLRIVETLKEYITILLGQILRIYTDHKKLTCDFLNNDIVLRWILIIVEYGQYI